MTPSKQKWYEKKLKEYRKTRRTFGVTVEQWDAHNFLAIINAQALEIKQLRKKK